MAGKGDTKAGGRPGPARRRRRVWRIAWFSTRVVVFIVAVPLVLTLVYTVLPAISTPMLARLVTGRTVERIWVPLDAIAPSLIDSVVTSEDARFCLHNGIDWEALQGQVERLEDGDRPRGASTIAMQLAKNLFLWPSRSYLRKTLEIPLALWIDLVLSKRRVLELYLNVAEWGDGVFGIEAASRHYFKISADKLSRTQAARLATALPNPIARNPADPSRRHAGHARAIRRRAAGAQEYLHCLDLVAGEAAKAASRAPDMETSGGVDAGVAPVPATRPIR